MRHFIFCLCLMWALSLTAFAQTVVYQDDFEGAVSGWSVNDTNSTPQVGQFLGLFDSNQTSTSRTFSLPPNSTSAVIEFDLYRFDSWDNFAAFGFDRFEVDINGTQVFSLPFPNPQAARSGTTGNVDWSHTPLTGMEELGFVTGQFWFDQLHRFVLTVNNPGATLNVTLRADLSQPQNDESAGFDNFSLTAIAPANPTPVNEILAIAENFPTIDGAAGGNTISVLSSDTLDGVIVGAGDVTITSSTSSAPNVTLNPNTGIISVAQNSPSGTYTVEYEICETANPTNCDTVVETITVINATGGGASFCPAGFATLPGTFHVVSANGGNNPNGAVGQPLPEGTVETANNAAVTFFGPITMDLTGDPAILVPEGEVIEVVLSSHFGTNGRAEILMSVDGVNYTSLGTTGNGGSVYGAWQSNVLRYDDFTVPAGGARFLQVFQQASGVRADGVIYNTQCAESAGSPELTLAKAADDNTDRVVGDVITYTYTVENTGDVDINDVTVSDVHNGSGALTPIMVLTLANLSGNSSDDGADDDVDVLAPGDSAFFEASYVVTAADAAAGVNITNTATATATPTSGTLTDPIASESVTIDPFIPAPSMSMDKVADNPGPYTAGDVITYTYTVTNNGNADINGIAINDTHNGSDPAPVPGSETLLTDTAPAGDSTDAATDGTWDVLAPGDAITFTGTYTVTQADAENL